MITKSTDSLGEGFWEGVPDDVLDMLGAELGGNSEEDGMYSMTEPMLGIAEAVSEDSRTNGRRDELGARRDESGARRDESGARRDEARGDERSSQSGEAEEYSYAHFLAPQEASMEEEHARVVIAQLREVLRSQRSGGRKAGRMAQLQEIAAQAEEIWGEVALGPAEVLELKSVLEDAGIEQVRASLEGKGGGRRRRDEAVAVYCGGGHAGLPCFKGKVVDDAVRVFVVGARSQELPAGARGHVELVVEGQRDAGWLDSASEPVDEDGLVEFQNMRLMTSTRMVPATFEVRVTLGRDDDGLTAVPDVEVIGISNEGQWPDAAAKLFLKYLFPTDDTVLPFGGFFNHLQDHYLRALVPRADRLLRPAEVRGLAAGEAQYIRARWFGADPEGAARAPPSVSLEAARKFWAWYGPILQALKFKRHIGRLWAAGLLYGFIARPDTETLLADTAPGTFLIRFSESLGGSFAIAYRDSSTDAPVKHYLVNPEDISSHKSLPDHLRDKPMLSSILALTIPPSADQPPFHIVEKDLAFREFYSKRRRDPSAHGYVVL